MTDDKQSPEEKKAQKIEGLLDYAKTNSQDTIAYILLVTGLILMFFQSYIGTILVGAVVGFIFSEELAEIFRSYNDYVQREGIVKTLILGGLFLAIFISLPMLVVTAIVVVGIKQLIGQKK